MILHGTGMSALGDPIVLDPQLTIRNVANTGPGSIRLARNPQDDPLYYLKGNGDVFKFAPDSAQAPTKVYSAADHHAGSVSGIAIGPDGAFYLTSNRTENNQTISTVTRGRLDVGTGQRVWRPWRRRSPIRRVMFPTR